MPFFPDNAFGLAYLAALVVFGVITWAGPNHKARQILLVLTIHWLTMRAIASYDHENFILWVAHDYVFFFALLYVGGRPALACAALFLIMSGFDSYSLVIGGSFEGASAVAETLGYLSMIIMAGGAYGGDSGKLARTSGSGSSIFRGGKISFFQSRVQNAGRARQPLQSMGRVEKMVQKP